MEAMSKRPTKAVQIDGKQMAALLRSLAEWSRNSEQKQLTSACNSLAEVFEVAPEQDLSTILAKIRTLG
jgi:hypothetical protein